MPRRQAATQPSNSSATQDGDMSASMSQAATQPAKRSKTSTTRRPFSSLSAGEKKRSVESIARGILFRCCCQGRPVKRDDVLKFPGLSGGAQGAQAFAEGAAIVNDLFGLQLAELPPPEKADAQPSMSLEEDQEQQRSTGVFTLVSTLPRESQLQQSVGGGQHREQHRPLINLDESTQARWGFLMTLLGGIYVNKPKHEMSQADLWHFLDKLGVDKSTLIGGERADRLVDTTFCTEQKYLVRLKVAAANPTEQAAYMYRWGPRARAELSEFKILEFLAKVYGRDFEELLSELNLAPAVENGAVPANGDDQ